MKVLAWDIENTPLVAYTWTLWPNSIPITNIIKQQEIMSFSARWVDKRTNIFRSTHHDGKEKMLQDLWDLLDEADALLSWNGAGFDTKHANREFLLAGMTPPSPVKEIDLMRVAKKRFKFSSNKLDNVAKELGIGEKTKHTGMQLWIDCLAGDEKAWRLMKRYNKQDVDLLIDIYNHFLPWIDNHPTDVQHGIVCPRPTCASPRIQLRGTATTQAGVYQRFQCLDCGGWGKFAKRVAPIGETRPL